MFPPLESSWLHALSAEFEQDYMLKLMAFLNHEKQSGKAIYPQESEIFNALNNTPLNQIKAVILGQDPYHGPHQAHGLSFSVTTGTAIPPSLKNIFKELSSDLGISNLSGDLSHWAEQGVLLLNSVLTVEHAIAGSHQNKGWETFTDHVISTINKKCNRVVFMLWGSYAQKKGQHINKTKHLVLNAPHPSPLSAYRGFFGCNHFSQCNNYLNKHNKTHIDWKTLVK